MTTLQLLESCGGILAHIKEKASVLGLQTESAKKKQTALLSGLLTWDGLRAMMERRSCYAADTVFLVVTVFTDRSLCLVERKKLILMNGLYNEMLGMVLLDLRGDAWVQHELVRLRSDIWEFKSVAEKIFATHCSSVFLKVKVHLVTYLLEDSERFRSLLFTDARLFEFFTVQPP